MENINNSGKQLAKRNSNFELLRIICMLMIIAFHYCVQGNHFTIMTSMISLNQVVAIIFGSWGLLGVDCYIFISANFLIDDGAHVHTIKIFKIILQTSFYSILILAILYALKIEVFNTTVMIKSIFAPFFGLYWFVTAYCILYFISPWLNKIIYSMNQKYLLKFLIVLTIIIPIYKTIWREAPISDIIFVIYLYLLMGYLKRTPQNWFEKHAKKGFILAVFAEICYHILMSLIGTVTKSTFFIYFSSKFIGRYSPIMVLAAIFLFYIFKNIDIRQSKLINTIASTTLGIYLFHENPVLLDVLWDKILNISVVYYSHLFICYFLASVVILFVIGMIVDLVRQKVLEKPIFSIKLINNLLSHIDKWIMQE